MISVIIPVHNEAAHLPKLIQHIDKYGRQLVSEIIVCDGNSTDGSVAVAQQAGATVLQCNNKSRAIQMNRGAKLAKGNILYFVHADTLPPKHFDTAIASAVKQGFDVGRCRTKFMSNSVLLKLNAFFTRFDIFSCYGGDQTLFITKELFNNIGGFDETKAIMEDYDITERARKHGRYTILKMNAEVSARKYNNNSWLKVQRANYTAVKLYKSGTCTTTITHTYRNMLK